MILDEIVARRRADLTETMRTVPVSALESRDDYSAPRLPFRKHLQAPGIGIIAEIKKASPSKGLIRPDFDPVAVAHAYERHGASAISVLTEERYFRGSPAYLQAVRRAVGLPLLRKDFLFDPYQVIEARAWGADAVLLIVAVLRAEGNLGEMLAAAEESGLDALVEVHDESELEHALVAGAPIVGINNRDLRTFVTTLETAERLRPLVPPDVSVVAESGIRGPEDVRRMAEAGFDAVLVGECLMRVDDPGEKLTELLAGAAPSTACRNGEQ